VKLLMLTKFVPMPANSGGKQRSLAVLRTLAESGEVTLCAFDDGHADLDAIRRLGVEVHAVPRVGRAGAVSGALRTRSLSAARFWSRALLDRARAVAGSTDPDVVLVAYSQLAPYGPEIPARHRILDLHNVESSLFASYAASAGSPARRLAGAIEQRALERIERRACAAYDTVLVVSETDAERLPGRPRRLLVCPNGTPTRAPLPMGDEPAVVFVGLLGWRPNADAARWFSREVWPRVRGLAPGAHLYLVGREPTPEVRALAGPDITVTGAVPDVDPYLARARVAVAPLLAGGGSRLKILEALGAGRPVVSTAVGAEGLTALAGQGLTIADHPDAFAREVAARLLDPERAQSEGLAGNAAVLARFSWPATLAPLTAELGRLATGAETEL
jgi:glycosyltransferase involved in cell wall biosynthesis